LHGCEDFFLQEFFQRRKIFLPSCDDFFAEILSEKEDFFAEILSEKEDFFAEILSEKEDFFA